MLILPEVASYVLTYWGGIHVSRYKAWDHKRIISSTTQSYTGLAVEKKRTDG